MVTMQSHTTNVRTSFNTQVLMILIIQILHIYVRRYFERVASLVPFLGLTYAPYAPLARLIQNGFTGEAKVGETRKTDFSRLLVHFNPGLQNSFTLQCLDLRKIDEAEAGISRAKEALSTSHLVNR